MDAIDWINQITSWLLLLDVALLFLWLMKEEHRR